MAMELHTNENYVVCGGSFPEGEEMVINNMKLRFGYRVINRKTDQLEYVSLQLPDAIATAAHLDLLMRNKPWEASDIMDDLFNPTVNPDGTPVH